jgi:prepilin-type N-terminal cleavage/methylation domain-containing protein
MSRGLRRLGATRSEAGFTLVELLVASAMGVVVLSGVTAMVIGVMRTQPEVSKRAQNISTARWVLERLTRELRSGVLVEKATPSEVSFRTYVRRTICGGAVSAATVPAIECKVTYSCTTTTCSRGEAAPASESTGTMVPIFSENNDSEVFSYSPSAEAPTYVGITLHIANPGSSDLTISDGASLRNATLEK